MITIVGMGVGPQDLTLRGKEAIQKASKVFVRTRRTEAYKALSSLGVDATSCDDLYDQAQDFDSLHAAIADRLNEAGDCVYCVDGAGVEDPVLSLLDEYTVIPGVAAAVSAAACSGTLAERLLTVSAHDLAAERVWYPSDATVVVTELDDVCVAGEVKLKLLDVVGDVDGYLVAGGKARSVKVEDLDRQKGYGADCAYVLPRLDYRDKRRWGFEDLMKIVFRLRAPDGCSWDRVQTHKTIRDCCIEEAYELVEAIDLDDVDKMLEESGDVLLQAVFHASLSEDAGEFSTYDMLSGVTGKMLFRHPHVFGNVKADDPEAALAAWEAAKAVEKHQQTYTQRMQMVSPMPALMRAKKIQKIARKANFDWADPQGAYDKVNEELAELKAASSPEEQAEEGGDLLFAAVNVLRMLGVEPELALLAATRKFADRFAKVEAKVLSMGKQMTDMTLDELDAIWNEIKHE